MNSLGVNRPVPEIITDMLTDHKGNKKENEAVNIKCRPIHPVLYLIYKNILKHEQIN